ncbi:hypothetical protein HOD95_06040 [archaeon]|nr:hypothetical protein [archaeon]MBT4272893.1 hypothetical protein [archaeon]MBT6773164.1 hypothetical protein [archaeon]
MNTKHIITNIIVSIILLAIVGFNTLFVHTNYFLFSLQLIFVSSICMIPYLFISEKKKDKKFLLINSLIQSTIIILVMISIMSYMDYQINQFEVPNMELQEGVQIQKMFASPTISHYIIIFIFLNLPYFVYFLINKNKSETKSI